MKSLTTLQRDQYARDGFLRLGKILTDAEVTELQMEYDRVFALARDGAIPSASLKFDNSTSRQMVQIIQISEISMPFRRLLYLDRLLDPVEDILSASIQLFHDQALFKPALHGGAFAWHQDNAYWRCTPNNMVSIWLTLDDVDEQNGAMQFIPGSHDHIIEHGITEGGQLISPDIVVSPVVVDLPAGGATLHHCQVLHYTAPNTTNRQRRALAIHLMPAGTRSEKHGDMPVSFSRPLLRLAS